MNTIAPRTTYPCVLLHLDLRKHVLRRRDQRVRRELHLVDDQPLSLGDVFDVDGLGAVREDDDAAVRVLDDGGLRRVGVALATRVLGDHARAERLAEVGLLQRVRRLRRAVDHLAGVPRLVAAQPLVRVRDRLVAGPGAGGGLERLTDERAAADHRRECRGRLVVRLHHDGRRSRRGSGRASAVLCLDTEADALAQIVRAHRVRHIRLAADVPAGRRRGVAGGILLALEPLVRVRDVLRALPEPAIAVQLTADDGRPRDRGLGDDRRRGERAGRAVRDTEERYPRDSHQRQSRGPDASGSEDVHERPPCLSMATSLQPNEPSSPGSVTGRRHAKRSQTYTVDFSSTNPSPRAVARCRRAQRDVPSSSTQPLPLEQWHAVGGAERDHGVRVVWRKRRLRNRVFGRSDDRDLAGRREVEVEPAECPAERGRRAREEIANDA